MNFSSEILTLGVHDVRTKYPISLNHGLYASFFDLGHLSFLAREWMPSSINLGPVTVAPRDKLLQITGANTFSLMARVKDFGSRRLK